MNVFLVSKSLNKNIFQSQLLAPLSMLSNNDFIIKAPFSLRVDCKNCLAGQMKYYKTPFDKYKAFVIDKRISIVYTRSVFEFLTLFLLKKILFKTWEITYDFRGVAYDESFLKNGSLLKSKILKRLEKFAFKYADNINTVSHKFDQFLVREFKISRDISVIPCCITEAKLKVNKVSSDGVIKFVYLGSASKWQKLDLTIELYKLISKKINSTLTIITNDIKVAEDICSKFGVNANVVSLPHDLVYKEIQKYDFGFLLRDNILMNNVSSPLKYLEYIGNGVIPIITEGVGDYSDLTNRTNIGVLYNTDNRKLIKDIEALSNDKEIHQRLYDVAKTYTWDSYYKAYSL